MKHGEINCSCGKLFAFETINDNISCLYCGKTYDVRNYPIKHEQEPEPEEMAGEIYEN